MKIEELLNISDIAEFISQTEQFLQSDFDEDEFKRLLQKLNSLEYRNQIAEAGLDTTKICEIAREALMAITVDRGDLPELADLVVYNLFINAKGLEKSPKAEATIQSLQEFFGNSGLSALEKLYMATLECFLTVLNGEPKRAIGLFIRRLSMLHLHECSAVVNSHVITPFFESIALNADEFFLAIKPLFEKEFYFSLDKTQRRSVFNWMLHCFWQYPAVFNHPTWNDNYGAWKELLYEHMNRDECDQAMYVQFFIYHVMGNSFQEQSQWREFNDSISIKTSAYYANWATRNKLKKCKSEQRSDGKKLIAMTRDRVVMNSPMMVEYSVFKKIMTDSDFTDKYDLVVYNLDYVEKSDSDSGVIKMLNSIGIPVINVHSHLYTAGYYHSHLEKALLIRDRMIADSVDVMIVGSAGYDLHDFLLSTRTAPKQIVWVHGNFEYDVPGIDKKITHIGAGSPQKQSDYPVEHFDFVTDEMFTKPEEERNKQLARNVRARFSDDTVVLGSIGRLVKMDNYEYLGAVAEIMKQAPNTVYLACGSGNVDSVKQKAAELDMPMDRFLFEGQVDPHVYGYVIDVYINTFPEPSGQAAVEFQEKNKYKFLIGYNQDEARYGVDPKTKVLLDVLECCCILKNRAKDEYMSRFEQTSLGSVFKPSYDKLKEIETEADKVRQAIGKNKVVLGAVCHFDRVSDEYLNAVKEILDKSPQSVYVLFGVGDYQRISNFVDKNSLKDRFIVDLEVSDPHVCSMAIDVVLDTFPYRSGPLFEGVREDTQFVTIGAE
jgi:hypothetical protein